RSQEQAGPRTWIRTGCLGRGSRARDRFRRGAHGRGRAREEASARGWGVGDRAGECGSSAGALVDENAILPAPIEALFEVASTGKALEDEENPKEILRE